MSAARASEPGTSWRRALRQGVRYAIPSTLVVGAVAVSLDVLNGQAWGASVARAWPVLLCVFAGVAALLTLLFGFVFGHSERAAARVAHEGVAMHSAASLMAGAEQGGALVLTGQRLLFAPHALNLGAQPTSVPLGTIREVYVTDGGRYGEAVVYLRGGDALTFRLWDAPRWAEAFAALGIRRAEA